MKYFEENELLELKKSTSELKEAIISIVAILNKHGAGELYFGIKNDGTLTPYFAFGRAYLRVADEDRQLTSNELQKMIIAKAQNAIPWDAEAPDKYPFSIDEIDENTMKEFIKRANAVGRIDFPFTNKVEILKKLKLMSGDILTNAAWTLFGGGTVDLQMAVFAGVERLTFIDIKRESGNIFKLIDAAELYIKNMIKWRVKFGKMQREEIPEIPIEAIREAIVNSFAHRDYRNNKGNEVAIFKDRIEIYNPGGFPEGYTPEDFIKGEERSILRNKIIAQILYYSKDIESWGSGIKRIYSICKENGIKVDFKNLKSGFVVVFHRPYFEKRITSDVSDENNPSDVGINVGINVGISITQQKVISKIIEKPEVTAEEIAEQLGLKSRTIERAIQELKRKGIIERKVQKNLDIGKF